MAELSRAREADAPALVLEGLTVAYRRAVACNEVSLRVPAGQLYALLGRSGAGKSSLLACVLGERKPSGGRVLVCGADAWARRRKVRELLARIDDGDRTPLEALLARALARGPRLLLLDDIDLGREPLARSAVRRTLREVAARGVAVLFATGRAADADGLADRVGILHAGRLLVDEDAAGLVERFRRIGYRNEVTATRTEYGTELDHFDAVRVRVRGWGVEAVVSNFSQEGFERLRATDGVVDPRTASMTLEEIFDAVAPEPPVHGQSAKITR